MDKNEYNIDEILSEVKKRKENSLKNSQAENKSDGGETKKAEKSEGESKTSFNLSQKEKSEAKTAGKSALEKERQPGGETKAQKAQKEAAEAENKTPEKTESAPKKADSEAKEDENPQKKAPKDSVSSQEANKKGDTGMINIMDFADTETESSDEEPKTPVNEENKTDDSALKEDASSTENEEQGNNIADGISEDAETKASKNGKKNKNKKPKSKTKKIVTAIIAVLLALIIAAGGVFAFTANDWINDIVKNSKGDKSDNVSSTEEWKGMDKLIESFDPIKETEADSLSSLEDMVQSWYYNGSPCSSTHVLNVLLIGEDTRGDKILDEGTRADSAIIASVNIDTKKITLTSILRDSWAYWETSSGKKESGQFGKINGAMSTGNIRTYMRTIENLYKVKLDGYAIVNFDSFESIVNTLGGVTLEITQAEIQEINRHPKRYGYVYIKKKFEGTSGKQKLNGRQALAYCRIRHIDSDGARADRQKECLLEIFKETKSASTTKLLKIIQTLIPYIKTSFGKSEIVKIATYAFSKGWLDYDTVMCNVPEINVKGGSFKPEYGGQWVWKADFPADAYIVQKRIYGKSSITLAHERVDVKTVRQSGIFADGARATDAVYTNKNYNEESTVPTTKKETTTKKKTTD